MIDSSALDVRFIASLAFNVPVLSEETLARIIYGFDGISNLKAENIAETPAGLRITDTKDEQAQIVIASDYNLFIGYSSIDRISVWQKYRDRCIRKFFELSPELSEKTINSTRSECSIRPEAGIPPELLHLDRISASGPFSSLIPCNYNQCEGVSLRVQHGGSEGRAILSIGQGEVIGTPKDIRLSLLSAGLTRKGNEKLRTAILREFHEKDSLLDSFHKNVLSLCKARVPTK